MIQGHNGGPPIRDAGWYATHRDMLNHPIVGIGKPVKPADPSRGALSRFEAWHWLIANAAYSEQKFRNKGAEQTLQPGQLVGGREYLAKAWNWSEKTVRWFLKTLIDEQMITLATDRIRGQQRANTANIITLCNYLKYQLGEDEQRPAEGPPKGQPTASEGPANGQIYNKETNKQITTLIRGGSDELPRQAPDLRELERKLLDACNGSLDNPVNRQGLLDLSTPLGWLNSGADLELDVLPTLRAVGHRNTGKGISSWNYFTKAVAQAMANRMAGLPAVEPQSKKHSGGYSVAAKLRAHRERLNGGENV